MRFLLTIALAVFISLAVSACSVEPDADTAKQAIRDLIPEAAGFPNESWERVEANARRPTGVPSLELLGTKPLTVGLAFSKIIQPFHGLEESLEVRRAEFSRPEQPRASKISDVIERTIPQGYLTAVHADFIKEMTCEVSRRTAAGTFSVEIPEIGKGTIHYSADYKGDKWRITELRLPAHNWKFVVDDSGKWKWFDFFGDTDNPQRFPPAQKVTLSVKFEGQPVGDAAVIVSHLEAPEVSIPRARATTNSDGVLNTVWPVGRYAVLIKCSKSGVNYNYKQRDGSKMQIEVREGKNHFVFDLVETEFWGRRY